MKKKPTPADEPGLSAGLRRFLYLTAAYTGAAILIVEILGAKMLSPYLGTSHFVWTAQIAVTLMALATGYYFGGWLVDRSPRLGNLYACLMGAAIYLSLTVLIVEPMAYWCLKFKLAIGSIIASMILFFVPLTLMATVCPFLVRVLTQSVTAVGGQVGRLTAVSTLGSVFGTVLIGYVLIPLLPNSVTMYVTALLLMVLGVVYFLGWGRPSASLPGLAGAVIVGLLFGLGAWRKESLRRFGGMEERYRHNSNFGLLQVLESKSDQRRWYLNDYLIQNTYDPKEKKSLSMFTYALHELARAYASQITNVLCIGLGVGIVPMEFARAGVKVDVVEINPDVARVARTFFDLAPERLNIVFGDGRYLVNQAPSNAYDAIILDAFLGDSSPSHLMTREAFGAMRRILRPGAPLVINCFGHFEYDKDFFTASLDKTLKNAFQPGEVRIHDGGNGNVFFVASTRKELKILHPPSLAAIPYQTRFEVENAFARVVQTNPDHGRVLTDDYNPVEFHDAQNREYMRRRLALLIRSL